MKLIALDLDGTLFNNKSQISKENIKAIKEATAAGINVVISTGRPFGGLPFEAIKDTGIRYAITANGSAIYEIDTKKCLYENCLSDETAFSIIDYLMTKRVHMDAFINATNIPIPDSKPAYNVQMYNDLSKRPLPFLMYYKHKDNTNKKRQIIFSFI